MPSHRGDYTIESLARGLRVLTAFGPARPEMSLQDIADHVDVSKAGALRLGHTLCEAGFLVRVGDGRGYRLGPTAITVGLATTATMALPEVAEPLLVELRDVTGETAQLAVPHGTDAVIVGRVPSRQFPPNPVYIGHRVPIHAGSLGRAMLAAAPAGTCDEVLARSELPALTPRTATTPEAIRSDLDRTRRRGWALNDQQTTVEHRSLAAAIRVPSGAPVGAVNITVSASRVGARVLARTHAAAVVHVAARISELLPEDFAGRTDVA
ncbi:MULTISPECIES: IclR family transcriptional regulator [unclassified Pseudonocardia]|uniref:IclR family transcriptional regulator n=1 Tax=unclassified Pseudonocardia TaxID=2619320 RepID=UPI0001FFF36E|nr:MULTISPECIES: IclR family transcriptional regulator [unclassified Pseudonocardia]ALL77771.1 hypothetical protein AD006_25145 [Pseudonocardia sp. EC080610-09]ALL80686.1 hypothetical protein AD017_04735 [Pseudonocardia sp. EC080619-01]OLM17390.1 Transcriptional regulator, IclR family [Pseudonocardia sp. Ae707_Ps1]